MQALAKSWREGIQLHHREHVNEYILEQPLKFRIGSLKIPESKRSPDFRLTIDTEADYQRVQEFAKELNPLEIDTTQLLKLSASIDC